MANQPPYYPQQQQPPPPKKGMSSCLIAVIVMVVVGVPMLGVFAALGIYGVRRYLVAAKTAEAKNTIGAITRGAVAAYERDSEVGSKTTHHLCDSAKPVPAAIPKAVKYLPSSADGVDYHAGSPTAGWPCLRFEMTSPQYYQYSYVTGSGSGKSGAPASGFESSARGDLDGNGVNSFFARGADVRNGQVVLATEMVIENEFE